MKIAYLDCFSGVSGDMLLGALIDAGVSIDDLRSDIAALGIPAIRLETIPVLRRGIRALSVRVVDDEPHRARRMEDVEKILRAATLDDAIREKSLAAFRRLASVEGAIHGRSPEEVHFHELAASDTLVDVVGAFCAFRRLGVGLIASSPVNVGGGTVSTAHGIFPVPAPATAELLRGVPVFSEFGGELTTPTGALLLTALATSFGPMPPMRIERIGHGAGERETPHPNVLRLFLGEAESPAPWSESVCEVETNIDDMNPQIFGALFSKLADAGAMDVFLTPVQMKKNRPGMLLTAVCGDDSLARVIGLILRETTTLGVRYSRRNRVCLERRMGRVETPFGPVAVKIALMDGNVRSASPEYEDCARLALQTATPLADVLRAAGAAAAAAYPTGSPDPGGDSTG